MVVIQLLIALVTLLGHGDAQRPTDASICEYHAEVKFGANNSATQLQLIQGIIGLAFGGAMNLTNVASDITDILNLGTFTSDKFNLRPWFDGSGFECDSELSQSPLEPRPRSSKFCLRAG